MKFTLLYIGFTLWLTQFLWALTHVYDNSDALLVSTDATKRTTDTLILGKLKWDHRQGCCNTNSIC